MIDIHSHVLPGIDDGSKDMDMTLEMLRIAEKDGTTDIVATPHYCIGYGEESYDSVKERVLSLRSQLQKENININIHFGQEVYFSNRLLDDLEEGVIGTINGGRYLLIELNMKEFERDVLDTLYELKLQGIIPIIAHPERYSYIQRHPRLINDFINEGCLFQLNAGSITGRHGEKAKESAKELLKNNIYSFIGSDGHNITTRKTEISESISNIEKINKNFRESILENSKKLLEDEEITFCGEKFAKKKKGMFSFLRKK